MRMKKRVAMAMTMVTIGTDNNQLKAVTAMANGGGDGNSDDDSGRRRRHDNGGSGGQPTTWRRWVLPVPQKLSAPFFVSRCANKTRPISDHRKSQITKFAFVIHKHK